MFRRLARNDQGICTVSMNQPLIKGLSLKVLACLSQELDTLKELLLGLHLIFGNRGLVPLFSIMRASLYLNIGLTGELAESMVRESLAMNHCSTTLSTYGTCAVTLKVDRRLDYFFFKDKLFL